MTDRELLELAAKVAEMKASENDGVIYAGFGSREWNPLADDGDAFRLAVKLHICTLFPMNSDRVKECGAGQVGGEHVACMEPYSTDPCAATRRAIVRAAAEVGRRMP